MGVPPPHQGPPMHIAPPDMRGPHEMRGAAMLGEPRGPMMDQRGPPMDSRGTYHYEHRVVLSDFL